MTMNIRDAMEFTDIDIHDGDFDLIIKLEQDNTLYIVKWKTVFKELNIRGDKIFRVTALDNRLVYHLVTNQKLREKVKSIAVGTL